MTPLEVAVAYNTAVFCRMTQSELLPEHRNQVWIDSTGDYWKFIDGAWNYQKGTDENEWESTESDEEPNGYGPFGLA